MRLHADFFLKLSYATLHLEHAGVRSVGVVIQNFDLAVKLPEVLYLIPLLSLDLATEFVFLVQRCVFVLNDVHLKDCPSGVFLSFYDLDLSAMIFDLGDDVDEDLLEAF